MAPLAAPREVDHYIDQELRTFPVKASTKIYKGAFVGIDAASGFVRPLVAGDLFVGVAYETIDNTGANGALRVRCYTQGDFDHALAAVAQTDLGDAVYASDDNTLTQTSSSNSYVGWIEDIPSSGNVIVRIDPMRTAK